MICLLPILGLVDRQELLRTRTWPAAAGTAQTPQPVRVRSPSASDRARQAIRACGTSPAAPRSGVPSGPRRAPCRRRSGPGGRCEPIRHPYRLGHVPGNCCHEPLVQIHGDHLDPILVGHFPQVVVERLCLSGRQHVEVFPALQVGQYGAQHLGALGFVDPHDPRGRDGWFSRSHSEKSWNTPRTVWTSTATSRATSANVRIRESRAM